MVIFLSIVEIKVFGSVVAKGEMVHDHVEAIMAYFKC